METLKKLLKKYLIYYAIGVCVVGLCLVIKWLYYGDYLLHFLSLVIGMPLLGAVVYMIGYGILMGLAMLYLTFFYRS